MTTRTGEACKQGDRGDGDDSGDNGDGGDKKKEKKEGNVNMAGQPNDDEQGEVGLLS